MSKEVQFRPPFKAIKIAVSKEGDIMHMYNPLNSRAPFNARDTLQRNPSIQGIS